MIGKVVYYCVIGLFILISMQGMSSKPYTDEPPNARVGYGLFAVAAAILWAAAFTKG